MEYEDEPNIGLPKVPEDECAIGAVSLEEILLGKSQDFHFEMPKHLEKRSNLETKRPVEMFLHPLNRKQMELKFENLEYEEVAKVMFGDYSEIREIMTEKVTEDGGVMKMLLRPGTGRKIVPMTMVRIHYLIGAELMDDLIESTYTTNSIRRYRVGAKEMIPAMDLGVATMRAGEISKFLATSEYAFGKLGVPMPGKWIPADVCVMLQVEVLEAYESKRDSSVDCMSSAERRLLPFNRLFAYAEGIKMDGNKEFETGDYNVAATFYLGALECVQDLEPISIEEKFNYCRLRQQLNNNLAHMHFKLGQFKRALVYAETGERITSSGLHQAKSHYWCAKALYELGQYEKCLTEVKKAEMLHYDPNVKLLKFTVDEKLRSIQEKEKKMFARMMNLNISD